MGVIRSSQRRQTGVAPAELRIQAARGLATPVLPVDAVPVAVEQLQRGGLAKVAVEAKLYGKIACSKCPCWTELAADLPREDSEKGLKRKLHEPFWAATGGSI